MQRMLLHVVEDLENPLKVLAEYDIGTEWEDKYDLFFISGPSLITDGYLFDVKKLDEKLFTFLSNYKLKWVYSVYLR